MPAHAGIQSLLGPAGAGTSGLVSKNTTPAAEGHGRDCFNLTFPTLPQVTPEHKSIAREVRPRSFHQAVRALRVGRVGAQVLSVALVQQCAVELAAMLGRQTSRTTYARRATNTSLHG